MQSKANEARVRGGEMGNLPFVMSNEMVDDIKKSGLLDFKKVIIGYNNNDFMRRLMSVKVDDSEEGLSIDLYPDEEGGHYL